MKEIDNIIFEDPRKTFMEILRVNNQEVHFANILAFFLRPHEKHGLGLLFLKALLQTNCYNFGKENTSGIVKLKDTGASFKGTTIHLEDLDPNSIEVIVEQKTKKENRIDILIVAEDFVVCIEFKINHDLDNPLQDYSEFIHRKYSNKKYKYFVVLTPYAKDPIGVAEKYLSISQEFKQVILSHFFSNIQEALPDNYFSNSEHLQYYHHFQDLVQTVRNRKIRSKRYHTLQTLNKKIIKSHRSIFHNNISGGYLTINKNKFTLKIRIKISGWYFEKWTLNNQIDKVLLIMPENSGYNELQEQVIELLKEPSL